MCMFNTCPVCGQTEFDLNRQMTTWPPSGRPYERSGLLWEEPVSVR
jgi:hypothetical protein